MSKRGPKGGKPGPGDGDKLATAAASWLLELCGIETGAALEHMLGGPQETYLAVLAGGAEMGDGGRGGPVGPIRAEAVAAFQKQAEAMVARLQGYEDVGQAQLGAVAAVGVAAISHARALGGGRVTADSTQGAVQALLVLCCVDSPAARFLAPAALAAAVALASALGGRQLARAPVVAAHESGLAARLAERVSLLGGARLDEQEAQVRATVLTLALLELWRTVHAVDCEARIAITAFTTLLPAALEALGFLDTEQVATTISCNRRTVSNLVEIVDIASHFVDGLANEQLALALRCAGVNDDALFSLGAAVGRVARAEALLVSQTAKSSEAPARGRLVNLAIPSAYAAHQVTQPCSDDAHAAATAVLRLLGRLMCTCVREEEEEEEGLPPEEWARAEFGRLRGVAIAARALQALPPITEVCSDPSPARWGVMRCLVSMLGEAALDQGNTDALLQHGSGVPALMQLALEPQPPPLGDVSSRASLAEGDAMRVTPVLQNIANCFVHMATNLCVWSIEPCSRDRKLAEQLAAGGGGLGGLFRLLAWAPVPEQEPDSGDSYPSGVLQLHEATTLLIKLLVVELPLAREALATSRPRVQALVRAAGGGLQRRPSHGRTVFGGAGLALAALRVLARRCPDAHPVLRDRGALQLALNCIRVAWDLAGQASPTSAAAGRWAAPRVYESSDGSGLGLSGDAADALVDEMLVPAVDLFSAMVTQAGPEGQASCTHVADSQELAAAVDRLDNFTGFSTDKFPGAFSDPAAWLRQWRSATQECRKRVEAARRHAAIAAAVQQAQADAAMAELLAEEEAEKAAVVRKSGKAAKRKQKAAAKKAASAEAAAEQQRREAEAAQARREQQAERERQQREAEQAEGLRRLMEQAAAAEVESGQAAQLPAPAFPMPPAAVAPPSASGSQQQRADAPPAAGVGAAGSEERAVLAQPEAARAAAAGSTVAAAAALPQPPGGSTQARQEGRQGGSPAAREEDSQEAELQDLLSHLLPGLMGAPASGSGGGSSTVPVPATAPPPAGPEPAAGAPPGGAPALAAALACPLTGARLVDPWICGDGRSYERAAIFAWLAERGVSPVTGEAVAPGSLRPNLTLRTLLEAVRLGRLLLLEAPRLVLIDDPDRFALATPGFADVVTRLCGNDAAVVLTVSSTTGEVLGGALPLDVRSLVLEDSVGAAAMVVQRVVGACGDAAPQEQIKFLFLLDCMLKLQERKSQEAKDERVASLGAVVGAALPQLVSLLLSDHDQGSQKLEATLQTWAKRALVPDGVLQPALRRVQVAAARAAALQNAAAVLEPSGLASTQGVVVLKYTCLSDGSELQVLPRACDAWDAYDQLAAQFPCSPEPEDVVSGGVGSDSIPSEWQTPQDGHSSQHQQGRASGPWHAEPPSLPPQLLPELWQLPASAPADAEADEFDAALFAGAAGVGGGAAAAAPPLPPHPSAFPAPASLAMDAGMFGIGMDAVVDAALPPLPPDSPAPPLPPEDADDEGGSGGGAPDMDVGSSPVTRQPQHYHPPAGPPQQPHVVMPQVQQQQQPHGAAMPLQQVPPQMAQHDAAMMMPQQLQMQLLGQQPAFQQAPQMPPGFVLLAPLTAVAFSAPQRAAPRPVVQSHDQAPPWVQQRRQQQQQQQQQQLPQQQLPQW
eukprot:scaffold2.g7451.t1